jgi:hypothetical protein
LAKLARRLTLIALGIYLSLTPSARTRIICDQKALERVVPGRFGKDAVEFELPALAQLGLRACVRV